MGARHMQNKRHVSLPEVISSLLSDGYELQSINKFIEYHKANKKIWEVFEQAAVQLCNQGKTRLSSKALFEDLRRSEVIQAIYKDWKVNNTYSSFYPRIFELYYPQFKGRFEMRSVGLDLKEAA
jgi:hypothetical protein